MIESNKNAVSIGSKVSLFLNNIGSSPLEAKIVIDCLNKSKKENLDNFKGIEEKVWVQVGENDRVYAIVQEEKKGTRSLDFFLLFNLTSLMFKDLQSGATLFAGIEHPNYNVRTPEIPRSIFESLS
ncbi:MAG: hypothetical protein CMD69_03570 [Gammaproteobacteria bacterium]|nr:hypothetical protein [Gammaproteobacteria bacterium]|tara:strand:- start:377 stop:754 length:378 start_codon:yes stop_codon:yes gene_type:complete